MLRNIQTLVAWHAAAHAAIRFFKSSPRVPHIRLVELADYSSEAITDMKTNGRAIVDSLKKEIAGLYTNAAGNEAEPLYDWIEDHCKVPQSNEAIRPLRVHAEAGLMALLKKAQGPPPLESRVDEGGMVRGVPSICVAWFMFRFSSQLDFFSEMQNCAIGVSKKCCYMCYLLKQCMFDDADDADDAGSAYLHTRL